MIVFTPEELNMMADGIVLIKSKCGMDEATHAKLDALDKKLCDIINGEFDILENIRERTLQHGAVNK